MNRVIFTLILLVGMGWAQGFDTPFYKEPAVLKALAGVWERQALGNSKAESSFVIHGRTTTGDVIMRACPDTYDYSRETFSLMPGDKAIFHTHPNSREGKLSTADIAIADRYGVEMYVLSKDGLWMYRTGHSPVLLIQGTSFLQEYK